MRKYLHTYTFRIYSTTFCVSFGLYRYLPAHPVVLPLMRFLFVRSVLCLRFPPDSFSRKTPCPFS